MRAAVTRGNTLSIERVDDPVPGSGHVLVRPLSAGICGSDLHALEDLKHFADLADRVGMPGAIDPDAPTVFGHEYCAEILEYGPDTDRSLPIGQRVCSYPVVFGPTGPELLGYSQHFPGALGELMVLQEALLLPVADSMATDLAALTEPLAVGEHAVAMAELRGDEVCLVVGCGPVGLAVIGALKGRGVGPVIATDFSPRRRALAEAFGADEVIDPAEVSPHERWGDHCVPRTIAERTGAELMGASFNNAVIFEAVGVPGMLQELFDAAPPRTRIVVVGVCMHTDTIEPFVAIAKELDVRFAFAYSPDQFAATLARLEAGMPGADSLVTDVVALEGAPDAFVTLRSPGQHGKILVRPTNQGGL